MLHLSTPSGEILARRTTDHPLSSYGTPIWSVEIEAPDPGPVILENTSARFAWALELLGIVDGWAVLRDTDHTGIAVVWSDGAFHTGIIRDRETGEIAHDITLEKIEAGACSVDGAVMFPGSVLGCVL